MMKRRVALAFTITEVLVVTAILAALAGLLFPVFRLVRARSNTNVCLSNLKQIGSAISLYASDYDDFIPYAPDVFSKAHVLRGGYLYHEPIDSLMKVLPDISVVLEPYGVEKSLFRCPSDYFKNYSANGPNYVERKDTMFEEYGSSYKYDDEKALQLRALSGYPNPAQNLLAWDHSFFHGGTSGSDGLVNVLFADFHVKTITWGQRTAAIEADL